MHRGRSRRRRRRVTDWAFQIGGIIINQHNKWTSTGIAQSLNVAYAIPTEDFDLTVIETGVQIKTEEKERDKAFVNYLYVE